MAAQLGWSKFSLDQARAVLEGFLHSKVTPLSAGRIALATAERAMANSFEAALNLSRTGQLMLQDAFRPFQKAVTANAARLSRP